MLSLTSTFMSVFSFLYFEMSGSSSKNLDGFQNCHCRSIAIVCVAIVLYQIIAIIAIMNANDTSVDPIFNKSEKAAFRFSERNSAR